MGPVESNSDPLGKGAGPDSQRVGVYPGIDAQHVQAKLDPKVWAKLFVDITPQDLKQNAMAFPISAYFTEILNEYERIVSN